MSSSTQEWTTGSVAVAADGTTTVLTRIIPNAATRMWVEVANADENALDAFAILLRAHEDGSFHTVADSAADFTTALPNPPILASTGDFTSLAADSAGLLILDVHGGDAIRFTASGDGATHLVLRYRFA